MVKGMTTQEQPDLHSETFGDGRPLVLVHGLGSSWITWAPVLATLARTRRIVAIDLPGHGESAPLGGEVTVDTIADAIERFLRRNGLETADLVGSSLGARLVLELARRGLGGHVVALDPGGFWTLAERAVFAATVGASVRLVRFLQPWLRGITASGIGRRILLFQFSARAGQLDAALVLSELRSYAASTGLDATLKALTRGANQVGAAVTPGRVAIGWGTRDRVTVPAQAERAQWKFAGSSLHWFDGSGHFPHWDQPDATARFILANTGLIETSPAE